MDFAEINEEYYAIFRGQASSIPVFTDREYKLAIRLANNAIRKWERADGTLWRELKDMLQLQNLTIAPALTKVVVSGTTSYATPSNMRKPPSKVSFFNGTSQVWYPVIKIHELENFPELTSTVAFIGSANSGYTMYIGSQTSIDYNGYSIDYMYNKKATMFSTATDPAAEIPEMSDPNFIIHEMVASRYANARNGFGYKVAKADATTALMNMRIENDSGDYNSTEVPHNSGSWGSNKTNQDIIL